MSRLCWCFPECETKCDVRSPSQRNTTYTRGYYGRTHRARIFRLPSNGNRTQLVRHQSILRDSIGHETSRVDAMYLCTLRIAPKSAETLLVEQCNFVYDKWCIKPWFVNTVHGMYNITIFIDLYQVHCFPTRSKFFIIHQFKNTNFNRTITPILNYTETILRNKLTSPLQKTPYCNNTLIYVIL